MKRIFILLILGFLFSCSDLKPIGQIVSIYTIFGNPGRFMGERVIVVGFLSDEGYKIHVSKESSDARDRASSIYINLTEEHRHQIDESSCKGQYVRVTGTFGTVQGVVPDSLLEINTITQLHKHPSRISCLKDM